MTPIKSFPKQTWHSELWTLVPTKKKQVVLGLLLRAGRELSNFR